MGVRVKFKGPLVTGRAKPIVQKMISDTSEDLAAEAYKRVRARLNSVLRNPTGYFESRVTTSNTTDGVVISDGGVIYGPWLEGVSSRNSSTRFKGYNTFRLVAQSLGKDVEVIADRSIQSGIGRLR